MVFLDATVTAIHSQICEYLPISFYSIAKIFAEKCLYLEIYLLYLDLKYTFNHTIKLALDHW